MAKESKGKKLRRCAKQANYYKVQYGKTLDNKARRLRRRVHKNPLDVGALKRLKELVPSYGLY